MTLSGWSTMAVVEVGVVVENKCAKSCLKRPIENDKITFVSIQKSIVFYVGYDRKISVT